jgi:hypothetical protein
VSTHPIEKSASTIPRCFADVQATTPASSGTDGELFAHETESNQQVLKKATRKGDKSVDRSFSLANFPEASPSLVRVLIAQKLRH